MQSAVTAVTRFIKARRQSKMAFCPTRAAEADTVFGPQSVFLSGFLFSFVFANMCLLGMQNQTLQKQTIGLWSRCTYAGLLII